MKSFKLMLSVVLSLSSFGVQASDQTCEVLKRYSLTDEDVLRMSWLEVTRSMGLAAALNIESAQDRQTISGLFSSGFTKIENPEALIGDYQCRTIKLGGNLAGIVYGWFGCEIFPEEAALVIRKISGSQRFFGLLSPAGNGLAYRGALHYGYEDQVMPYNRDATRNQVGCFSAVDASMEHFVLELPAPQFESVHDVIEFKRSN